MTSLLALPNELLQHVAFYLPFSAIVKLQCVNRRLHEVYNDRLVLQDATRNGLYNTTGTIERLLDMHSAPNKIAIRPAQLLWPEGDQFLHQTSIQGIKALAYIVEKCANITSMGSEDWTIRSSSDKASHTFSDWLPQLLALHHPATLCLKPDALLRVHGEINRTLNTRPSVQSHIRGLLSQPPLPTPSAEQLADLINVNFILSFITLQHLSATLDSKDTLQLFTEFFYLTRMEEQQASRREESEVIDDTMKHLCERVPGYGEHRADFNLVQASSVVIPMIFSLSAQFPRMGQAGDLPKPNKMPFQSFMNVPSDQDSALSFSTCHLRTMTSPEFLTGRWTGYYSDQRAFRDAPSQAEFDFPMRDIRIVAQDPSEQERAGGHISAAVDRRSQGVDAHGHFILEGQIFTDGTVRIAKRYTVARWAWTWTGCITPFGIVGFWGNNRFLGGYFWIWKEEWC
jgi:hypothetical protein